MTSRSCPWYRLSLSLFFFFMRCRLLFSCESECPQLIASLASGVTQDSLSPSEAMQRVKSMRERLMNHNNPFVLSLLGAQ
jgi:hypothetical protein